VNAGPTPDTNNPPPPPPDTPGTPPATPEAASPTITLTITPSTPFPTTATNIRLTSSTVGGSVIVFPTVVNESNQGLSQGATIGIGVGAGAGGISLIAILAFCLWRLRRRRRGPGSSVRDSAATTVAMMDASVHPTSYYQPKAVAPSTTVSSVSPEPRARGSLAPSSLSTTGHPSWSPAASSPVQELEQRAAAMTPGLQELGGRASPRSPELGGDPLVEVPAGGFYGQGGYGGSWPQELPVPQGQGQYQYGGVGQAQQAGAYGSHPQALQPGGYQGQPHWQ
jgi:hypothetical protein